MPTDAYIVLGIAGFFFIMFAICFLRANADDKREDSQISQRIDVKGFNALHIAGGSLRTGAWIFFLIAVTLFILGVVFLATQ